MLRSSARPVAVTSAALGLVGLALAAPALAGPAARDDGDLVRYDTAVPADARAKVHSVETGDGRTIVTLHVTGMRPDTAYGAHAHTRPCGTVGREAGPHYQRVLDPGAMPTKPSVDPRYANPQNEIWLDLTTNAAGNGHAKAVVDWAFEQTRRPASVIIHAQHTSTGPTDSGTAGPRLACLSVDF